MDAQPPSGSCSSSRQYPRWVMLEQYLEIIKVQDSSSCSTTDDGGDPKTLAAARTSAGHPIQVSLRLADPPAISRLFLRIRDGVTKEKSKVLAAHGDSILIQILIEDSKYNNVDYTAEHFLYNAGSTATEPCPRPPSLSLLPPYYEKTFFSGLGLAPRTLSEDATGILRRGGGGGVDDGELVVAELCTGYVRNEAETPRMARLYLLRSSDWKWRRYKFNVSETCGLPSVWWKTVVPVNDRLLCWVNLRHGVMLLDVAFEETPSVRYVRLPITDPRDGRRLNRNVCATDGGRTLKFINIIGRICCATAALCGCDRSGHAYTIHTWTMRIGNGETKWVKDGMIDCTELWTLGAYRGLPCDPLDCPVVSFDEPDVICFRLRDTKCGSRTQWQIMVNMRSKTILSVSRHEKEVGYCYAQQRLMIPSKVSYFFNTLTGIVDEQLMIRDDHSSKPMLHPSEPASVQALLEKFEALREIPSYGLGPDDEVKAYRILINRDDDGRLLTSLARLPKDLRKDWLLMEIKATDDYCTGG